MGVYIQNWFLNSPFSQSESLHPFFKTAYAASKSKIALSERRTELENRINEIFKSMGGQHQVYLRFHYELFPLAPPCARGDVITLPILSLLSPKEFPTHLQVDGPDDPKLNDPKYFDQIADWIADSFSLVKSPVTWLDKQAFKLYLR